MCRYKAATSRPRSANHRSRTASCRKKSNLADARDPRCRPYVPAPGRGLGRKSRRGEVRLRQPRSCAGFRDRPPRPLRISFAAIRPAGPARAALRTAAPGHGIQSPGGLPGDGRRRGRSSGCRFAQAAAGAGLERTQLVGELTAGFMKNGCSQWFPTRRASRELAATGADSGRIAARRCSRPFLVSIEARDRADQNSSSPGLRCETSGNAILLIVLPARW